MSPAHNIIGIAGSQYWHTTKDGWAAMEAANGQDVQFVEISKDRFIDFQVRGRTFAVDIERTATFDDESEETESEHKDGALSYYDYLNNNYVEWVNTFPPPHGYLVNTGERYGLVIQPPFIYDVEASFSTALSVNTSFFIHRGSFFCETYYKIYTYFGVLAMDLSTPAPSPYTSESCVVTIGDDSVTTVSNLGGGTGGVTNLHSVHTFSIQSYF